MTAGTRTVLETVHWEDEPERTRNVVGYCKRCYPDGPEPPAMLVSPSGIAHYVSDWGVTDCGKAATLPDWWWRT